MKRLFGKMKKAQLEPEEKADILLRLQNFVAQNPGASERTPFYSLQFYFWQRSVLAPAIVFLVFVLTGGSVVASRNSLPGDTLYPIKMLREDVESKIVFGYKGTAKVNTYHAVSRLKEVEQIVAEEKPLNKETRVEIEKKFEVQAEEAINNINQLESTGNDAEASKMRRSFVDSLSEREQAMRKLIDEPKTKTNTKAELSNMVSNIQAKIGKVLSEEKKNDKDQTASLTPVQTATSTPETPDENASTTPVDVPEQATSTASSTPEKEQEQPEENENNKRIRTGPRFWR